MVDYVSFEVRLREKLNELDERYATVLESADQRLLESRSERPMDNTAAMIRRAFLPRLRS